MPFDVVTGADGRKVCPDVNCRGHAPQRAGVELRVRAWTRRVRDGPVQISRSEQVPFEVSEADRVCEFCGAANVVDGFVTGPDGRLRWPVPTVSPATVADEVLPAPTRESKPLEERVGALEAAVRRLGGEI